MVLPELQNLIETTPSNEHFMLGAVAMEGDQATYQFVFDPNVRLADMSNMYPDEDIPSAHNFAFLIDALERGNSVSDRVVEVLEKLKYEFNIENYDHAGRQILELVSPATATVGGYEHTPVGGKIGLGSYALLTKSFKAPYSQWVKDGTGRPDPLSVHDLLVHRLAFTAMPPHLGMAIDQLTQSLDPENTMSFLATVGDELDLFADYKFLHAVVSMEVPEVKPAYFVSGSDVFVRSTLSKLTLGRKQDMFDPETIAITRSIINAGVDWVRDAIRIAT